MSKLLASLIRNFSETAVGCAASYFVKIIWCSRWFCTLPPYFEALYCFICGRRRVAVPRYRMICLVLWFFFIGFASGHVFWLVLILVMSFWLVLLLVVFRFIGFASGHAFFYFGSGDVFCLALVLVMSFDSYCFWACFFIGFAYGVFDLFCFWSCLLISFASGVHDWFCFRPCLLIRIASGHVFWLVLLLLSLIGFASGHVFG